MLVYYRAFYFIFVIESGGWFNIKMSSYQYRKYHFGDQTILRPSYLHNGISYTGSMTSLYWIMAQCPCEYAIICYHWIWIQNLLPGVNFYFSSVQAYHGFTGIQMWWQLFSDFENLLMNSKCCDSFWAIFCVEFRALLFNLSIICIPHYNNDYLVLLSYGKFECKKHWRYFTRIRDWTPCWCSL